MTTERRVAFLYGADRKWNLRDALDLCGRVGEFEMFGRPMGRWRVVDASTREWGVWVVLEPDPEREPLVISADAEVFVAPVGTLPGRPGWERLDPLAGL